MAGKGELSQSDAQPAHDGQNLIDASVVNAEDKQASTDAVMSVRRAPDNEDEQEKTLSELYGEGGHAGSDHDDVLQLAQADTASSKGSAATNGPASVGEELLRQSAPVPVSAPAAQTKATGFEAWLKSDWGMPITLGGGALALLGLAAAGGRGSGSTAAKGNQTPTAAAGNNPVDEAIPENMYGLTITPAAGPFNAGAAVRVSVQKLMPDGGWREVATGSTVDATGRMHVLVEKTAVGAGDMLRLVLTDSKPQENDYNDEVSGQQSLGNVVLQAIIGGLSGNAAVTVNPLTTLAAKLIGADFSAAHVKAVNAAVAAAFGLRDGDLILTIPALLTSQNAADAPPAAINYGLALGIVSGMTQAQRDAHAADPLQATLDALADAPMNRAADGSLSLDLSGLRQLTVNVPGSADKVAVGLDAGAARLHDASAAANGNIASAQVPYVQVDTSAEKPAAGQKVPDWSKAAVRLTDFIDGLTIKVAPAASAKVGDTLTIEFLPLDANGVPLSGGSAFTFKHIYTQNNVDKVSSSRQEPGNKGVGSFTVVVPTYDPYLGKALPSSSDPNVYLFNVDALKHYDFAAGNIGGYQMRATGAVVGLLGAGSNFSVDARPISIFSGPKSSPDTFNGESNSSSDNTIRVKLVLPKGIRWDGADPSLKLQVTDAAGVRHDVTAIAELTTRDDRNQPIKGGSIWSFAVTLSNSQEPTKGLDGALSIPANAVVFAPGTKLFDQDGNLLYTNDGGVWKEGVGGAPVADIHQALGAKTALANTGFKVDTTRPATPILNFTNVTEATFDPDGYARDAGLTPTRETLNVAPKGVGGFGAYELVTTKVKQDFTVTFDNGAVSPNDVGATVVLTVDSNGITKLRVASTKIVREGSSYKALFTDSDYIDSAVKRLVDNAPNATGGLMKLDFSVQVIDKAGNTSGDAVALRSQQEGGLVNKVYLDLKAPSAPSLGLAAGSDTGRLGAVETQTDNITSKTKPTIHVTGDLGTIAEVRDSNGQIVLRKWLVSDGAGGNSADLVIPAALARGAHTFTVTLVDVAGNAGPASSLTVNVLPAQDQNTPAPTVSFTSTPAHGGFYIVGDDIIGQVTFDREVYLKQGAQRKPSLNLGDINANSRSLNVELIDGFGTKTLTFRHKVVASDLNTPSGLTRASLVNADQLEDAAGSAINPAAATNLPVPSVPQLIDTDAPAVPTLAMVADIATHQGKASKTTALNGALTVTAEAGAQVELTFTGSAGKSVTKSVLAAPGNAVVAVPLTQTEIDQLGDGPVSVSATASDQATNRSIASTPVTFTLDGTAPTATASSDKSNVATNTPISFTVKFSEALNRAPVAGDFQADHGVVQSVVAAGADKPNQYVVTVKPENDVAGGSNGKVKLSLSQAGLGLTDVAGNPMAGTAVLAEQAIDTQGPMVLSVKRAVAPEASTPLPSQPFDLIVTFNEKIGQFSQGNVLGPGNFTVSSENGGTPTVKEVTPIGTDGTQYKVTVDPGSLSGNSNTIKLGLVGFTNNGGTVLDELGNRNPGQPDLSAVGGSVNIDARAPSAQAAAIDAVNWVGTNPRIATYYHAGDEVVVKLSFDEAIKVTGQPTLKLDIGGVMRQALYDHTDGRAVYFKYTLTRDDNAPAGIAIPANALGLPASASITDLAGNVANPVALAAVAPDAQYLVDNIAPRMVEAVVSAALPGGAVATGNAYTVGAKVMVAVRFDDVVKLSAGAQPTLTLDLGGTSRPATYLNMGADEKTLNFSYTIAAGDNAGAGVVVPAHALQLKGATLTDVSGNPAQVDNPNAFAANSNVIVDTLGPTVTDIHISNADRNSASGLYHTGDRITVTVTFSEPLAALALAPDAVLRLSLQVGGSDRKADFVSQSADRKTLSFIYPISTTDRNGDITIPADALQLLGGATLTDVAGNNVAASASNNVISAAVGANPAFKVDNEAPVITDITSTKPNGTYNVDDIIEIRATSSKALQVGAQVTITLDNDDPVTLTRDATDPSLLKGSYTVLAGPSHVAADLNVKLINPGASAVDQAGNSVATRLPPAGHNLADNKDIALNTLIPATPTRFELAPGSDAGSSSADGLTSVNRPTFLFAGLKSGARVEVSAVVDGVTKSFSFIATGAITETYTLNSPLTDGVYRNITVRQIDGGNASAPRSLGGTAELGVMTIDTVAPAAAPSLVIFDDLQDRQTVLEVGTPNGTLQRDFRTIITTPRFDFRGGKDGETALLFRDLNNNGVYDSGDLVLGRAIIGNANATEFPDPASPTRPKISGHYVEVGLPLPNGQYSDIYLALQSPSGATSSAVKASTDPTGSFQIRINSTAPAVPLTSVSTDQASGDSSGQGMNFTVVGGQIGATITIQAKGPAGSMVTVGNATLDATRRFMLDVSSLEGAFNEFKAIQTWNGTLSGPMGVLASSGNPFGSVTWDHRAPTVTISPVNPDNNFVPEGGTVSVKFAFSKPVTGFDTDDVVVTGGTLGALTWNTDHNVATAVFTANQAVSLSTVSLQVKPGSYTSKSGVAGEGSNALALPVNHTGTINILGGTGSNAAPKVGDSLSVVLTDVDTRDTATPPTYVWSRITGTAAPVVISGQSGSTYQVGSADVGSVIRVEVTYRDMFETIRFAPTKLSKDTVTALGANDPGTVTVAGNAAHPDFINPGDTLTASVTDSNGLTGGQPISYQWLRDGVAINGATSSTYAVQISDVAHNLSVRASYTDDQNNADHPVSAAALVKATNLPGAVTIDHVDPNLPATVFKKAQVLVAHIADGDGVPGSGVSYQWFKGEDAISGATNANYTIAAADEGRSIKVKVIYTDQHGYHEDRESTAVSVESLNNREPQGELTFQGSGLVGSLLMIRDGVTDPDDIPASGDGARKYEWFTRDVNNPLQLNPISDNHFVAGTLDNRRQIQITDDLVGKDIVVKLVYTDNGGTHTEVLSTAPMHVGWDDKYSILGARLPLRFTGDAVAPAPTAQLLRLKGTTVSGDSDLYILDVNGDGQITQDDATTYISKLGDVNFGGANNNQLWIDTSTGKAMATLLRQNDPAWAALLADPGNPLANNGTATGTAGKLAPDGSITRAADFWTSTPGRTSNSHMVFTTDPAGPYSKADNSYPGDPGRYHYHLFHLSVIPV